MLSGSDQPNQGSRGSYVLVVEDDRDTRHVVTTALRAAGLQTIAVSDGATAIRECERRDPAVILLDLGLPGMDGRKFAETYRLLPGGGARILVMTASPDGAETAGLIQADAYLSKPFPIERLIELVEALAAVPPAQRRGKDDDRHS